MIGVRIVLGLAVANLIVLVLDIVFNVVSGLR
jgi:hypothetical protein